MLESVTSYTGWGLMTIVGPIVIGFGLAYGIWRAGSRRKLTRGQNDVRDDATRDLYKKDPKE